MQKTISEIGSSF